MFSGVGWDRGRAKINPGGGICPLHPRDLLRNFVFGIQDFFSGTEANVPREGWGRRLVGCLCTYM
eukprot:1391662-Amorphochlora_amoeboformis.AAC.1